MNAGVARISVLIPVFDGERYLREAIESALCQTVTPEEVVVVDDGSRDRSVALAIELGGRVRVVRQDHGGIGAARNRLVAEATGEWVAFLDADDRWIPSALADHLDVADTRPDADVVSGRVRQFISPELPQTARARLVCPEGPMAGLHLGASLIRRSAFFIIGEFRVDLKVGEFIDWWMRAREAGIVAASHEAVVLERRLHENNTGRLHRAAVTDYLDVVRQALARRRSGGEK